MRVMVTCVGVAVLSALLASCGTNEAAPAPTAARVDVAEVVTRSVTEFEEFTGHIEAVERVEIRPRVSGFISSVEFAEGEEVRKGDVLFVIDARPYEAELKRAKAELARAITARVLAKSERERATSLLEVRAISREEFDSRVAVSEQSGAQVEAAQAAVDAAALNMTFTRVHAPISGLIGKAEITTGNLVTAGATLLTTLVSIDPVYVVFEGDEQQVLRHAAAGRESKGRLANVPVWVGLSGEEGHPREGKLVFLNNEIDAQTGTIRARGRLDNADRHYTPGMFARVKLAGSEGYNAVLVKDSAVGTDQNLRFVFVVGGDNRLQQRTLELGPTVDGLRVVRNGLKPGEQIVMNGLRRVRAGDVVAPQRVSMEGQPAAADARLAQQVRSAP
jgi:RND family efflux transporter MFP subunit